LSIVQSVSAEAQVQEHNCEEWEQKNYSQDRAANFHFAHSGLLALVVIIFQIRHGIF